MRIVGRRKPLQITAKASGALLAEGCRFNEEIHRLNNTTHIPKGVYFFKTLAEADQHEQECIAIGMARIARERRGGPSASTEADEPADPAHGHRGSEDARVLREDLAERDPARGHTL